MRFLRSTAFARSNRLLIGNASKLQKGDGFMESESVKSYPWAVGFFFGNTELSLELWTVIAGIPGFDD